MTKDLSEEVMDHESWWSRCPPDTSTFLAHLRRLADLPLDLPVIAESATDWGWRTIERDDTSGIGRFEVARELELVADCSGRGRRILWMALYYTDGASWPDIGPLQGDEADRSALDGAYATFLGQAARQLGPPRRDGS